jgi:predicted naringenin-chalcone synthase
MDDPAARACAHINAIGIALPPHEAHAAFLAWAERRNTDRRDLALFRRMASRSGIERRWTVLPPTAGGDQTGDGGFYASDAMPPTSARMAIYADAAPDLCVRAVAGLGDYGGVTHLVLASCTGFIAPGIDQIVARRLRLPPTVERTLIGFMGCYAAVSALRTAHHIVRSQPQARALVVTVELCTLHLQPDTALEPILAMLLFGDGAAAALVTAEPTGLAIEAPFAATLPDSEDLIRWTIGDTGFAMHLSGAVPARIAEALADPGFRARIGDVGTVDGWAIHAGGRSVLDAVEQGFGLDADALADSRAVLRDYGNMSSATLMFVLQRILAERRPIANGLAIAFGPGLAAEGFRFNRAG